MAVIMLTVLFSRFFCLPGYLGKLGMIEPLPESTVQILKWVGDGVLALALIVGAWTVLSALFKGIREHKKQHAAHTDQVGVAE